MQKAILAGKLKPGDPISEREYGRRANVSRIPVREALIQLESKGLVAMIPDRGAFVRTFTIDEIRQLYEVRAAIEGAAARHAAGRMNPGDLDHFEAQFRSFVDAGDARDRAAIERVNLRFHQSIVSNCNNAALQRVISDVRDQVRLCRLLRIYSFTTEEMLESTRHHLGILEALRAGDGVKAEERMRAHVSAWHDLKGLYAMQSSC